MISSVAASGITVVTRVVGVRLRRDLASKSVQVTETVQHAVVNCSHHSDSYSAPSRVPQSAYAVKIAPPKSQTTTGR